MTARLQQGYFHVLGINLRILKRDWKLLHLQVFLKLLDLLLSKTKMIF